MTANATASLTIKLNDQVSPKAGVIQRALGKINSSLKTATGPIGTAFRETFGRGAQSVDRFAIAAHMGQAGMAMEQFRAKAVGALSSVLEPAIRFEDLMTRIAALAPELTADQVKGLGTAALELGQKSRYSAIAIAGGLEALTTAGYGFEDQIKALPYLTSLTQVSGGSMDRTAVILADVTAAFGKSASEAGMTAGMLASVANATTTDLETLYESLKYSAAATTDLGVSMQDTVALTGLLGNVGIKGSMAGTALRGMMLSLINPAGKAKKELAALGLSAQDLAQGASNPAIMFKKIFDAFESKNVEKTKRLKILDLLFGERGVTSASNLLTAATKMGKDGKTAIDGLIDSMNSGGNVLDQFSAKMGGTAAGKATQFKALIESTKINIGTTLLPMLTPVLADVTELVKSFASWAKKNEDLVRTGGKVLVYLAGAAAVLGPVLLLLAGLNSAITVLGVGFKLLSKPFMIILKLNKALTEPTKILPGIGSAAGQLDKVSGSTRVLTGLLRGLNAAAGLAAAAFVGWELGKMIDTAIGKLAGLRTGTISGAAGLRMGESDSWNGFMRDMGRTFGIKSLEDAAEGNRLRNREEMKTQADAIRPEPMPEWIDSSKWKSTKTESDTISWQDKTLQQRSQKLAPVPQQPVQVGGDIKIEISDKRTAVTKLTKKGPVNLQVGLLGNI